MRRWTIFDPAATPNQSLPPRYISLRTSLTTFLANPDSGVRPLDVIESSRLSGSPLAQKYVPATAASQTGFSQAVRILDDIPCAGTATSKFFFLMTISPVSTSGPAAVADTGNYVRVNLEDR